MAHFNSLVLHYNCIKLKVKFLYCVDRVKVSSVTERLDFQGCLFNFELLLSLCEIPSFIVLFLRNVTSLLCILSPVLELAKEAPCLA